MDIPSTVATTARLAPGFSLISDITGPSDVDSIGIWLVAGQTYEVRLHGIGLHDLDDPVVAIRNGQGHVLAQQDDDDRDSWAGGSSFDPRLTFTATATGLHFIDVRSYDGSGGRYCLTAALANTRGMVFTPHEIAWQLTHNYEGGECMLFNVGADRALTVNLATLGAEAQILARAALRTWTDVTGIAFVETRGTAEIQFADEDRDAVTAYAQSFTSGQTITSARVVVTDGWLREYGGSFNSFTYQTYIHEIGHALGLGHAGNYNGSATYGVDNYYLNDSVALSIMSYFYPSENTFVNASFDVMTGPGVADILAIQDLYGDRSNTRAGNTVYGFGSNTGNAILDTVVQRGAAMHLCVYDDGGIDTLNFANTAVAQTINLGGGAALSSVLGGRANLSIAFGTVIENAVGGGGADVLIGNAAANVLRGNGGADRINGGAGDDTLVIDPRDTAVGSVGYDTALLSTPGAYRVGTSAVERWIGSAGADDINATTTTTAVTLRGAAGADTLRGSSTGDGLFGEDGTDYLIGNAGNDLMVGAGQRDTLRPGAGNDTLSGGADGDLFLFDAGGGRDVVLDWQDGLDRLDFRPIANLDSLTDLVIQRTGLNALVTYAAASSVLVQNAFTAGATLTALDILI